MSANFQVQAPGGGLYLEGRFNGGFFALLDWGLIFGGAYTWRRLLRNFTVFVKCWQSGTLRIDNEADDDDAS